VQDFHAYLDVARALWELDDDRLEQIASSETATDAFREIATYVAELRRGLADEPAGNRPELESAALEKVAERLASRTDTPSIGEITPPDQGSS